MKKFFKKFKELKPVKWLVFQFNSIWNHFHWKKVIKEANELHQKTGKRYYVIPTVNKCIVVNNDWLKLYNKSQKKNKQPTLTHKQLTEMAYYDTGRGNLRRIV